MADELRVLVIEDTEEDAMLLTHELKRSGYALTWRRVWTAEAIEAALAEPWDIAISDWSMPKITGLDAFRIVRQHDAHLPFIIVSGTIGEEIAVDALKAGVDDFMSKGRFARLLPAIERARRDAQARREQREMAQRLEQKRAEIERSEQLLRVVLDAVPDGVIVADDQGNVLASNPAAGTLLGADPRQVGVGGVYERCEMFLADKMTSVPVDERPLAMALRGSTVDRAELYVRVAGRTDGRYLSISAHPLEEQLGSARAISVFHDITRERAAQEQLLISDRMASVGMLAAGVAHEINNPLAAVLANLDMLASDLAGASIADISEAREMLEDARTAANRVRQIVRDLKIFSRHEETEPTAVDVRRMLESTLRMVWNEIRHRARLVKDFDEVPPVRGSESRLGQVFINLIVNAAQAIPEGNVEANTIRVVTRKLDDRHVSIEVSDSGSGMSAETKQRLFTPFFTTKPRGVGTGLGLPIVQRIVSNLGGRIEVESELGKGTKFRVALPIAVEEVVPERHSAVRLHITRRARILVVDDEPSITTAIRRMFAADHDVEVVNRASDALARIHAGDAFDVILCDLMMPQMTGMDLYAELDKVDMADRIIFLTGGAFTPAARQFLDRVPNQRVEKPFDVQSLRALIADRVR